MVVVIVWGPLCNAGGVTMDGMTIAFHKDQSRIVHPWTMPAPGLPADEPADEPVMGAVFRERIFVQIKEARELLLTFTRSGEVAACTATMPVMA